MNQVLPTVYGLQQGPSAHGWYICSRNRRMKPVGRGSEDIAEVRMTTSHFEPNCTLPKLAAAGPTLLNLCSQSPRAPPWLVAHQVHVEDLSQLLLKARQSPAQIQFKLSQNIE